MKVLKTAVTAVMLVMLFVLAACGAEEEPEATEPPRVDICRHSDFTEANYQQGQICLSCGKVLSDPAPSAFGLNGISCVVEKLNTEYVYVTRRTSPVSGIKPVEGSAAVTSYYKTKSIPQADTPDGYEWHVAEFTVRFSPEVSEARVIYAPAATDYYDIDLHDSSLTDLGDGWQQYTVSMNGVEYPGCLQRISEGDRPVKNGRTFTFYMCVPEGYDGAVAGLCSSAEEGGLICAEEEQPVLFRMEY